MVNALQECVHTKFLKELGETQFETCDEADQRKSIRYVHVLLQ